MGRFCPLAEHHPIHLFRGGGGHQVVYMSNAQNMHKKWWGNTEKKKRDKKWHKNQKWRKWKCEKLENGQKDANVTGSFVSTNSLKYCQMEQNKKIFNHSDSFDYDNSFTHNLQLQSNDVNNSFVTREKGRKEGKGKMFITKFSQICLRLCAHHSR